MKGSTWLSGSWENHRALGKLVQEKGWKYAQKRVADEQVIKVKMAWEKMLPDE
jgi:hypothetical protein